LHHDNGAKIPFLGSPHAGSAMYMAWVYAF